MLLRIVSISKKFIPKFGGNSELPDAQKVVIHFAHIPGRGERSNYISYSFDAKGSVDIRYNNVGLVALVDRVENFEIEDENGIKKRITTGAELAALNHSSLDELFAEMREHLFPDDDLTVGELKA